MPALLAYRRALLDLWRRLALLADVLWLPLHQVLLAVLTEASWVALFLVRVPVVTLLGLALLTGAGTNWLATWQGWAPTVPKAFPAAAHTTIVLYTEPTLTGERVLFARGAELGLAELTRGRFGWRLDWAAAGQPVTAAGVRFTEPYTPSGELAVTVLAGEVLDPRAGYVVVGAERWPVNRHDSAFLLHLSAPLPPQWQQTVRLLDPTGQLLPDESHPAPQGEITPP